MSSAKETARSLIAKINKADSTSMKVSALNEMFSGISVMVEAARDEKQLASQLRTLDNDKRKLQSAMQTADDTQKSQMQNDLTEIESTISEAIQASKRMEQNRTVLRSLEKQLDSLRNEVRKALQ